MAKYTPRIRVLNLIIIIFVLDRVVRPVIAKAFDSGQCFNGYLNSSLGQEGGVDRYGRPVTNNSEAFGFTYGFCVDNCGAGSTTFDGSQFLERFSAWLLPWLALVSQLPFTSGDIPSNLISTYLAIGSPTLAAYSLALTLLNHRWIIQRFRGRNADKIPAITNSLQQPPLTVTPALLNSVEKRNIHTWSVSALATTFWVSAAYFCTVADAFQMLPALPSPTGISDGQAVGSAWLWLLPIVVGWMHLSPKCEKSHIEHAIEMKPKGGNANNEGSKNGNANVQAPRNHIPQALSDEQRTVPIFNYARFLPWSDAVEAAFAHGAANAQTPRARHVLQRFLVASLTALLLQWGTAGAAIIILWFTPTVGLGCRSFNYILYATVSTVVWIMLIASSKLKHSFSSSSAVQGLASILYVVGHSLAILNAVGILLACMLQFSNVYNNCFCNSSVLGLGDGAFTIILVAGSDVKGPWAGGVALAFVSAILYLAIPLVYPLLFPFFRGR